MTHLQVAPYQAADYLSIELSEYEKEYRADQPVAVWAQGHFLAGPAFTARAPDGDIVFMIGVHRIWPGVGEFWCVAAPGISQHPHVLVTGRELFLRLSAGHVRVQATVNHKHEEGVRLVEHFGFRPEGLMRRYGPNGNDFIMYSIVREG